MPAARWQTTLTEARRAPLPFALLSFSYAAYFLAALIALFAEGGVSESEEWHVFIVGWPTVPLAALAAASAGGLEKIVEFLLGNMSKRMAESLRDEMNEVGDQKPKAAEAAMNAVVAVIRRQADAGTITLITDEEEA